MGAVMTEGGVHMEVGRGEERKRQAADQNDSEAGKGKLESGKVVFFCD